MPTPSSEIHGMATAHPLPVAAARPASVAAQAVTAIVLGMLIVGVAGFSHLEVVHNAAHDTRHANAFPCH